MTDGWIMEHAPDGPADTLRMIADDVDAMVAGSLAQSQLIADLTAEVEALKDRLAGCDCPEPPAHTVVFGSSSKTGYDDLKARLGRAPGAFRYFVDAPRVDQNDITKIQAILADGCIPIISVWAGTEHDTAHNVYSLVANGIGTSEATRIGFAIAHEPTQKMTGEAFRAMYERDMPTIKATMPYATRLAIFMRWDWAAPASMNRHPSLYLPEDPSFIDAIGVDAYDNVPDKENPFPQLLQIVEQFAVAYGDLPIWVSETGCPDLGDWGRPAGYRVAWMTGLAAHVRANPRYQVVCWFSSDIGPNKPPSGWWLWTSPESVDTWRRIMDGNL